MSRTQVGTRLLGAGSVIQVVSGETSSEFSIATAMSAGSTPQSTDGVEVVTATITPKSATSVLLIEFRANGSSNNVAANHSIALFRDSTASALAAAHNTFGAATGGNTDYRLDIQHRLVAGSTTATTFKIRIGPSNASFISYVNRSYAGTRFGGGNIARITITEIAA